MQQVPHLSARRLTRTYPSGASTITIFDSVDFDLARGESVAITGESGAGKSTMLYLLGGLDRPTSGSIHYGGRDLTAMGEEELADFRNREIGFVWQSHNLLPEFTALENAMMPLMVRGAAESDAASAAKERLEEVGLGARLEHQAGELSGGEQQRVAIARALAGDPALLLADEPTGNLDQKTGEGIFALLTDIQRSRNMTFVMVSHNLAFARRCDRILRLDRGNLIEAPEA